MNEQNFLYALLKGFTGLVADAPQELNKRLKVVMKRKWFVGFNDRGIGHGDFAVMVKFKGSNIIVVQCPCREIADHIVRTHNETTYSP